MAVIDMAAKLARTRFAEEALAGPVLDAIAQPVMRTIHSWKETPLGRLLPLPDVAAYKRLLTVTPVQQDAAGALFHALPKGRTMPFELGISDGFEISSAVYRPDAAVRWTLENPKGISRMYYTGPSNWLYRQANLENPTRASFDEFGHLLSIEYKNATGAVTGPFEGAIGSKMTETGVIRG